MHDAANFPFHLLRPLWLLALIPVAAIFAMLLQHRDLIARMNSDISPEDGEPCGFRRPIRLPAG